MDNKTILLTRRQSNGEKANTLKLELTADERKQLRGRRKTSCGIDVLLQLPREGPLLPGDLLLGDNSTPSIIVTAAMEDLLEIRALSILELMQASYHLGNRHVDLEVHKHKLYLKSDPVLKKMLLGRGLQVKSLRKAFFPEGGAYIHNHLN